MGFSRLGNIASLSHNLRRRYTSIRNGQVCRSRSALGPPVSASFPKGRETAQPKGSHRQLHPARPSRAWRNVGAFHVHRVGVLVQGKCIRGGLSDWGCCGVPQISPDCPRFQPRYGEAVKIWPHRRTLWTPKFVASATHTGECLFRDSARSGLTATPSGELHGQERIELGSPRVCLFDVECSLPTRLRYLERFFKQSTERSSSV